MHAVTRFAVAAGMLTAAVSVNAQDPLWVAPGLSFDGNDPFWDFQTNPALQGLTTNSRPIYAISAHKTPSDPPGQWTVSLTIRALQGFGNPGYTGLLLAKWNPSAAVPLVLTHEADAVNAAYVDYNLNLEPVTRDAHGHRTGGRYAVFDRFNLVAGPALGYVDGRLKLFYGGVAQNAAGQTVRGILMDDLLDVTSSPAVAGHPALVAQPTDRGGQPLWTCHSPSPITGADGDVEGMFLAEGDPDADISKMHFAADLDPDTPHVQTLDSDSWLNAGGFAGATLLVAERSTPATARVGQGAWLVGDEVAPGDVADVTMAAYSPPGQPPAYTLVFSSHRWLPTPLSLPSTFGELAILPITAIGCGQVPDADQVVSYGLRIPRRPWLRGTTIPIQGLSVSWSGAGGFVRTLTNSATIRVH
jgi:hypothetical protein